MVKSFTLLGMEAKIKPEPVNKYVAPRDKPLKYPGNRPKTSFIVADGIVYPIVYDKQDIGSKGSTYAGRVVVDDEGITESIDKFLADRKAPSIRDRFAVIGYGSNPVPGTLVSQFGENTVVPVLFGGMNDADVFYNLISNQGYAFAEMALNQQKVKGNVGVTFLDEKQLKKMVETEQNYKLAFAPANIILDSGEELKGGENSPAYIFAGFRKIWVPESYEGPIAIAELPSQGRKLKALTQKETLDLAIEQFGLRNRGINSAQVLADYVRTQADFEEKPGKLKYDLQKIVEQDPHSLKPLAEQVVVLNDPLHPPYVFANN